MARRATPNTYLRGKIWWTWWYAPSGRKIRASTKQRDRTLARDAARRLASDALGPQRPRPLALADALAAYLAAVERRGRSMSTLDYYREKSLPLLAHFGEALDVGTLVLDDTDQYVEARSKDVELTTVAKELGLLRSALRLAKRRRLYDHDPASIMPEGLAGAYVPRERALPHDEYDLLSGALKPGRRDYLLGFCRLGVRDSELYRIIKSDLANGQVHIRGTKGRLDRADRWIPLTDDIAAVLKRRADAVESNDAPLFPPWGNVRRDLAVGCKKAGIASVSPNDLRRTFCTWLAEAGQPELVIGSLLGHAGSAMVKRVYARIGPTAQRQAIAAMQAGVLAASATPPALPPATTKAPEEPPPTTVQMVSQEPPQIVTLFVPDKGTNHGRSGRYGRRRTRVTPRNPVPKDRIELSTRGFSVRCSTN
jgi:integrase